MLDCSCRMGRGSRGYALGLLCSLLVAACGPQLAVISMTPTTPSPQGLRSVEAWEQLFLDRWDAEHDAYFLPESSSGDSAQLYNLAYGIDGNTAMYRATGNLQYLDRALLYTTLAIDTARDSWSLPRSQFQDTYRGWASEDPATLGQEVALNESYCWRYVTRLLRVIRETPALYDDPHYRKPYLQLLEFSEKDIFEKWFVRGPNSYIYRENTHMASHWAAIALNLALMTADETRRARYLEVFQNINESLPNHDSSLRRQLSAPAAHAQTLFWNDAWGSSSRPGQDVSHGNGVVAFIVEAHDVSGVKDLNQEWTDEDVRALAQTLDTVIWPAAGQYAEYVDGSGKGNGWFNDGFMKLGRYSVHLQRRLETHMVGRNTQFYGNAALNVWLLSETAAQ
ncbi:MAG: hypothetical protein ACJ8AT_02955 [Hyalangium sp.]|uniref:hypothetical protein n=1 Tax=Hyalangium sp. TaxID=2028555 RepID=UPI00389AAB8A